ncbi:MAG: protein kinase [Hyphomicrobiaceae bacterium]|nr:protein kinase [Hyphomicrobiaceae bacterium]
MTNLIALPAGTELVGDYRIERVLGAGGFGITYLADEMALDRAVTIKEYFPSDFAARNASHEAVPRSQDCSKDYRWGLDRFIEEAQTLARFDHPNIVRVYRYFRANNTGYMVLQWEEGKSLKTWLKELKRAPRQNELDEIIAPLLDALELIHKADFLHRDIAPDNVIVRKSGAPVLIDFGSARGEIAAHSKTVSALVKPGYSPYEQYAETTRQQGPWTDIYALAATIYHAVTGKRPPDAPSRMVHDEFVPAREAALSAYRASFLAAIDRALSLEIRDRPQSVAIWRGELLAPESPRQGWLSKALEQKREEDEARRQKKLAAAQASAAAHPTVPPPPDMPGPQGGLLDFLDRIGGGKPSSPGSAAQADNAPAAAVETPNAKAASARAAPTPSDTPKAPAAPSLAASATVVLDPKEAPAPINLKKPPAPRRGKAGNDGAKAKAPERAAPPATNKQADKQAGADQAGSPAGNREIVPVAPRRAPRLFTRDSQPKPVKPRSSRASTRLRPLLAKLAIGACVATAAVMLQNHLPKVANSLHKAPATAATSKAPVAVAARERSAAPQPQVSAETRQPVTPQIASVPAHTGGASLLRYSADGSRLFTTGADGTLKVWKEDGLSLIRTIPLEAGPATALAIRGDTALTGHAGGQVAMWDTATARKRAAYRRNEADVWSLAFAGDDTHFITATHDWKVALWNTAEESTPLHVFDGHENAVRALAFAPGAALLASGGADKTVKLWNLSTLDLVRTYRGPRDFITSIAISPDGKLIAAASLDGDIRIWSTSSRSQRRRFAGHQGAINQVSFAPDGRHLASAGSDGTVRVWDISRRRAIRAYTGHRGEVKAVEYSPDGTHIASAGADGTVRIWTALVQTADAN